MTANLSLNGCLGATQSPQPFMRERVFACGRCECVCAQYTFMRKNLYICVSAHDQGYACLCVCPTQCVADTWHFPWSAHFNDFIDVNVFLSIDHIHNSAVKICLCHLCVLRCAGTSERMVVNTQTKHRMMLTTLTMLRYIVLLVYFPQ